MVNQPRSLYQERINYKYIKEIQLSDCTANITFYTHSVCELIWYIINCLDNKKLIKEPPAVLERPKYISEETKKCINDDDDDFFQGYNKKDEFCKFNSNALDWAIEKYDNIMNCLNEENLYKRKFNVKEENKNQEKETLTDETDCKKKKYFSS